MKNFNINFKTKIEAENYLKNNLKNAIVGFCPYYNEEFLELKGYIIPCYAGDFENDWKSDSKIKKGYIYPDDLGGKIKTEVYLQKNLDILNPYIIEDFEIIENLKNFYICYKRQI